MDIASTLKAAVASGDLPGVAADKGVVFEGGAGVLQPDSVFWIASMTKAITGTAAMQLVERGKLSLDAPIGEVLPDLSAIQVLEGFNANGEPLLRPARRPITLRQLLTHTAGFCYDM